MTVLNAATVAAVLAVACPLLVCGLAFWLVCAASGKRNLLLVGDDPTPDDLMAVADAVAEPTAQYEPCAETWPVDESHPCGDGHWHRCTRIPEWHQRHVCGCGARSDDMPVLVVDPPTKRLYVPDEDWINYGGSRVHTCCLAARRDGAPVTDGCRAHLLGADLPRRGA